MKALNSYPSLTNKQVLITGGATGIGAALVTAFVEQGASVSFIDIDTRSANALVERLTPNAKNTPVYIQCDVTNTNELGDLIEQFYASTPIDVLVNNVADDQRFDIEEITAQQWQQSIAVNLDSAFFTTQAVVPKMKNNGGAIINFSSINAILGPANMPSYITAKAGLLGMTKAMARDYGDYDIRVNAILPGWIITEKQLEKWLTPEAEAEWQQQLCLKKRIYPEDVARLALFLASDDASCITSQEFIIDAGRT